MNVLSDDYRFIVSIEHQKYSKQYRPFPTLEMFWFVGIPWTMPGSGSPCGRPRRGA